MATERPVRLVLDASLLLDLVGGGGTGEVSPALRPGAEALLWRLRYSNLCVAICHPEEMPTDVIPEYTLNGSVYRELVTGYNKPHITSDLMAIFIQRFDFLEKTANLHSFQYILLPAPSGNQLSDESMLEWSRSSSCFYATSRVDEDLFSELQGHNWRVIVVDNERATKDSRVVNISKLQELLLTLAILIKKEIDSSSVLMVGYAMKQSREQDFGKRGAFPLYPSKNGLIFVPLSFELPLASQLHEVDIILHKKTDEIINIDPKCSINFPKGITFSAGMSEIIRFIEEYPDFCIIDPFKNISPLLDRLQIQEILVRLQEVGTGGRPKLRAPHSLKVKDFHGSELQKQLAEANLSFPLIVKPQVACGVADAHNMALVFQIEEFSNLSVPLPAILQEYIDHGSKIFKFYVIGDKVFHAVKNSMPNASLLKSSSGDEPLTFNSLKTLPVATKEQLLQNRVQDNKSLNIDVVEEAAKMLKESLGLTIFGFDVVVQEGSGDHVIVDLNYLPSFKEVPDSEAMPAFWDAIRKSYESKKGKMKT